MIYQELSRWLALNILLGSGFGFAPPNNHVVSRLTSKQSSFLGVVQVKEPLVFSPPATTPSKASFVPLGFDDSAPETAAVVGKKRSMFVDGLAASGALTLLTFVSDHANAIEMPQKLMQSSGSFDPKNFVPVCGASDNFYRLLQGIARTVVGPENFQEYGPLIASGLLRVRLELCVVESFFNEAVGPFIQENGLSWVLPIHETVETFLAGTVFALATLFILVGSTKILTVIFTYADFFVGAPMRLFGGFIFDRARGKPVTLDIGFGPFKTRVIGPKDTYIEPDVNDWAVDPTKVSAVAFLVILVSGVVRASGVIIGFFREILDAIDLFVGKSLVLWVTGYILIKFIHFKIFPDFPAGVDINIEPIAIF